MRLPTSVVLPIVLGSCLASVGESRALAEERRRPRPTILGSERKRVNKSPKLRGGFVFEGKYYTVHSDISADYTIAAAHHLDSFYKGFVEVFPLSFKEFKGKRPRFEAFAFSTEEAYLKFAPGSAGTWGRYSGAEKNVAWYSIPPGETEFYATDFEVVQHEATHQLLHAYTGNAKIPSLFHEMVATFFEQWDLRKGKKAANRSAGVFGPRGTGVRLSFPHQTPTPPLKAYWINSRRLLLLDDDAFKARGDEMVLRQHYDEAWCLMTYLVNGRGAPRQFLTPVLLALRDGADYDRLKKDVYSRVDFNSLEREWYNFIKTHVLKTDKAEPELTVGGRMLAPGKSIQVPEGVRGFPLGDDRSGELFIVEARSRLEGNVRTVPAGKTDDALIMLRAWSVPERLYREAWRRAPEWIAKNSKRRRIGGYYDLGILEHPGGDRVLFLIPARLSAELFLPDEKKYRKQDQDGGGARAEGDGAKETAVEQEKMKEMKEKAREELFWRVERAAEGLTP